LVVIKSGAEAFKIHADPQKAAEALGGHALSGTVYYCAYWLPSPQSDKAAFVMRFNSVGNPEKRERSVSILAVEYITGEEIFALTVTAGGGVHE
jgi:hypothetical protein